MDIHHFFKVDGQNGQSKMLRFNVMDFYGIPWKSIDVH